MDQEQKINELLLRWEQTLVAGQNLPAEEICADCPELTAEVQRRIDVLASRHKHLSTVRQRSATAVMPTLDDALAPTDDEVIFSVAQYGNFKFHAKGGLGEVFVAGDQELNREVALKFMNRGQDSDSGSQSQFQVEAEVAAQLEHPGVVPVYGLGRTSDGRPFQVMRYIRGDTLGDAINAFHLSSDGDEPRWQSLEFRRLLTCVISVCKTMAYAHSRGVIHRDIKPDNIMLGKYGETLVVDWGLAMPVERKRKEEGIGAGERTVKSSGDSSGTSTGVVGTPAYMSPEQAIDSPDIGPPTDIYSLGSMLYKVLTNVPPYQGVQISHLLDKVRAGDFPPPRNALKSVPKPLEAICLKAMRRSPQERYSEPLQMADDLERWLADEPVAVYEEPWHGKALRWARRHTKITQVVVGCVLAVLVGITAFATSQYAHREQMVAQRVSDLQSKANVEEEMLKSDFQLLRNDAQFLASSPLVKQVAAHMGQPLKDETKLELQNLFQSFMVGRESYMQARVLDREGKEIIRVDREKPAAPITVKPDDQLQNKGNRPYFLETKALGRGQVYLSRLELNQEHGKKQWDFPVIRGAVPILADDDGFQGIVIINMHFDRVANLVKSSMNSDLLVFLTNEDGEFLLHPMPSVGFSFERKLDYPIKETYPRLRSFYNSSETETQFNQTPVYSLLLEDTEAAEGEKTKLLADVDAQLSASFSNLQVEFSEFGSKAVILNLDRSQLPAIQSFVHEKFGEQVAVHELPRSVHGEQHAVYCRKIFVDPLNPDRFLCMVLALPY